jgi:hypothetical protein
MNNSTKNILVALVLVVAASGSFVLAQTAPATTAPAPATGSERGAGPYATMRGMTTRGMGRGPHQIHMNAAMTLLVQSRRQLEAALPDKGGMREKAIASVDQAIKDVQLGIDYAEAHPEEFPATTRGMRGTAAEGTAPTTTTAPSNLPRMNPPAMSVPNVGG